MTRINCVSPSELVDKHLLAEYRELPRVFALARAPRSGEAFPSEYTLGRGHVTFFYDKLGYLANRHSQLVKEMLRRGFKPSMKVDDMWHNSEKAGGQVEHELFGHWEPTEAAMGVNRGRIAQRLAEMEARRG